jgi:hypothetical protein
MFANFPLPVEPDVTFARISTDSIDLILVAPRSRVRFHFASGLQFSFNDLASDLFKIHAEVVIPTFGIYLLVPDPRGDMDNPAIPWLEVTSCTGNLEVSFHSAALGWEEKAQIQREFLESQDFQTKRCHFLYPENSNGCKSATLLSYFETAWLTLFHSGTISPSSVCGQRHSRRSRTQSDSRSACRH